MSYQEQLQFAKEAREREIKLLKICNCTYPLLKIRNMTGHRETCPAHKETLRRFEETAPRANRSS